MAGEDEASLCRSLQVLHVNILGRVEPNGAVRQRGLLLNGLGCGKLEEEEENEEGGKREEMGGKNRKEKKRKKKLKEKN